MSQKNSTYAKLRAMKNSPIRLLPLLVLPSVFAVAATRATAAKTPSKPVVHCKTMSQKATFATQVTAADQRRYAAMVKMDMKALAPLLANDLTYARSTGIVQNKAGFLDEVKNGKMRYRKIESKPTVRVYGETAILTGTAYFELVRYGKEEAVTAVYTSVYVLNGQGSNRRWQLAAWQSNFTPTKKILDHIKNYNKNVAKKPTN